jgi:signal transduction histidine kinase
MIRALPVHLIAIMTLVASIALLPVVVGPTLPRERLLAIAIVNGVYIAAWASLLVWMLRRGDARGRRIFNRAVAWGGNLGLTVLFWLAMPYASEDVRLASVAGLFATAAMQVGVAIERPPAARWMALSPVALPVALGLYFLTHSDSYRWFLAPFCFAHAVNTAALHGIIQRAVNRAFAARRTAESALAQAAAERDARTRFLASASHDLGQPLQAARLSFDQALRSPDAGRRAAAVRRADWAFDAMEELLRRILDYLRLDAGAVAPNLRPTPLGPLISRVAEINEPAARLANVEIVALPSRLAAAADAELTERALGNLVGNAIRHAKARRVLIGARRTGECVRVWVIDDGVGVAPGDAERLFEDFVQGSDHGEEIRGGFGLGLASARRMAGLMQGAVGLDGGWRRGSAFWLELPAAAAEAG